jgi:hypothetical protein
MSFYELVDERQRKECEFAKVYMADFNHGTPSHNHLALIAKLATHIQGKENLIEDDEFMVKVAKQAFEDYRKARGGIAFEGSLIPDWEHTAPGVCEAWIVAVRTAATMILL